MIPQTDIPWVVHLVGAMKLVAVRFCIGIASYYGLKE